MILGFDVSKYELVVVLINKRGLVKRDWIIKNERGKIEEFLKEALKKHSKLVAGCEATSEYHNLLAKCCLEMKIPFYVLNPIVTKRFTKATVRKKKTDLSDAEVIAKCILQGEGHLIGLDAFNKVKPVLLRTVSQLTRLSVTLGQMRGRFKEHFPGVDNIQEELEAMREALEIGIKRLRKTGISQVDKRLAKLLASIPGIGKTLSATLIAEIGDIHRFRSAKSLVAYAGLDPKVRQSGKTLKRNTRLTKRGSPYLRRATYLAASIGQRHDPELRAYYEKKRGEGKRYKEATVANARHILHRVYAVWKRGTPYVPCFKELFPQEEILTSDCRSRTCLVTNTV